jgi:hypothetical protein
MEARQKHSRRRADDPDADISYINDKNMRFNKKISRYDFTLLNLIIVNNVRVQCIWQVHRGN